MRRFLPLIAGVLLVALTASASAAPAGFGTLPDGVMYHDSVVGTGPTPQSGQTVVVQYTGWLYVNGQKGTKFDSSYDRSQPFSFIIADQQVIPGWDAGVAGMHVGGRRTLIIPPDQAYGDQGAGGVIPPGATLIFDIQLLGAN
jgi:peptidylprolyl isomerase